MRIYICVNTCIYKYVCKYMYICIFMLYICIQWSTKNILAALRSVLCGALIYIYIYMHVLMYTQLYILKY